MKKLVINLPHRQDRRELFQENNKDLQDWEFIEAINGFDISYQDVLDMGYDVNYKWRSSTADGVKRMKKGEIGCSISHLECWKIVAESDKPMIIMEDDAVINWDLWDEKYYEEVINRDDCEFLYLQHNDAHPEPYLEDRVLDHETDENLISPNWPYNMTAYVLTPECAQNLVDGFSKRLCIVDEHLPFLHRHNKIALWALKVDSCNQIPRSDNQSSIEVNTFEEDRFKDWKNVHFCTIGTDDKKLKKLVESAEKYDVPLKNIANDYDWQDDMQGFGGGPKIKMMYDFLCSDEVHDNDIVLFTDGYDTLFVDDGETIVERFLELNYDLVWAGESSLWPCPDDEQLINGFNQKYNDYRMNEKNPGPDKPMTPYLYLNSGGYIGRAWMIRNLFSEYENAADFCEATDHNTFIDDQEFCQRLFTRHSDWPLGQCIDYEAYIFQTNEEQISKLDNGQMWNPLTNTCGCIYHGNNLNTNWPTYERVYENHVASEDYFLETPPLFKTNQYRRFDVLEKDMIVVEFMDDRQCYELINLAEQFGQFQSLEDDKFPAQEIRLKELGLFNQLQKVWEENIYPIVEKYWHPLEMYGMRDAFVMKYTMDTQRSLNLHTDASLVTGSVKLNDNYTGGELYFPRQNISNKDIECGRMILFPGAVTHGHTSTELTSGVKYSLTMWSSRYPGDIIGK